jgi:hypothetical protein
VDPSLFASQEALKEGDYVWVHRRIKPSYFRTPNFGSKYEELPNYGVRARVIEKKHLPSGKPRFEVLVSHPCWRDGEQLSVDTSCFNAFRPTRMDAALNVIIGSLQLLHELRNPRDNNTNW